MDVKGLLKQASSRFGELVARVKPSQWQLPTPDVYWTVHDLVNHLTSELLWVPELLSGKTIAEVGDKYDGDRLGSDPQKTWQGAADITNQALDKLNDLERPVHLSYGDHPAHVYLQQMLIDVVIHGWDLAVAIGESTKIEAGLAQPVYELLQAEAENWRAAGILGPKIEVSDQADVQTKLLALSGRSSAH